MIDINGVIQEMSRIGKKCQWNYVVCLIYLFCASRQHHCVCIADAAFAVYESPCPDIVKYDAYSQLMCASHLQQCCM